MNIINIIDTIEKRHRMVVCLFFIAFLIVGIGIYKDYGVSWDEPRQRELGELSVDYVTRGDTRILEHQDRFYGPVFEMILVAVERAGGEGRSARDTYFLRHLITFLLFYAGVIFFYMLCRRRFDSWKLGLLGSVFLILSPRLFAHAFYNSKDIPFMAMSIISIYTLISFLDKKTVWRVLLHGVSCAILMDIRIMGLLVVFLTIVFLIPEAWKSDRKRTAGTGLLFLSFVCIFTVIFWPVLWRAPLANFLASFREMSQYPTSDWLKVLYNGRYLSSKNVPWHYFSVWMVITTPILYVVFAIIGCGMSVVALVSAPAEFYCKRRDDIIFLAWFIVPVIAVIVLGSTLYDGWRQMFFVYPAILVFSIIGTRSTFRLVAGSSKGTRYKMVIVLYAFVIICGVAGPIRFMIVHHPHHNVYFNRLAGKNMAQIKQRFDLDYWGLSYREALEYIVEKDGAESIKIRVANPPGYFNADMLEAEDRARLVFVTRIADADYFLTNYRFHEEEHPFANKVFSREVDGASIMTVYAPSTPEKVSLLNLEGELTGRSGDLEKAIKIFDKALVLEPDNAETLNNLGYAWYVKGDAVRAEEYFREALRVDPENQKAKSNIEYIKRAGSTGETDAAAE
ncbi:MAG: tetratricopeptide repeat protein [Candidatus Tantalella remota]|nr:tetratricopeptide repeat protein [Candidatus Tantalella remota]